MLEHEELPHVWCFLPWQQKPHCKPSFCLLHFSHLKKTLAAETTVRVPAGSRRLCCGGLLQSTGDTTLQLKNSWVGVTLPPLGINKNKGISDSNCACATRLFALLVPKSSVFITHIHTQLPVCPPNHNSPTIFFFLYSTTHPPVCWFFGSPTDCCKQVQNAILPGWPTELKKASQLDLIQDPGQKRGEHGHFFFFFFCIPPLKEENATRTEGLRRALASTKDGFTLLIGCSRPEWARSKALQR